MVHLKTLSAAAAFLFATPAWASKPMPWQFDLQPPATEIMEEIALFHNFLLVVIGLISALVLLLLLYCAFRFNARTNPEPSRISHNTSLEIIWTVIPILILVMIAIPSLNLLRKSTEIPEADLVIKAIGNQWYWEYEYSDEKLSFASVMIPEKELKAGQLRLLSVDHPLYVPVNKTVRLVLTSTDVLHAFAVPAFGIKKDTVPGRISETWFRATREGTYYGQCSELCGTHHAFMPIEVRVVSTRAYQRWLRSAKKKFAITPNNEGKTNRHVSR